MEVLVMEDRMTVRFIRRPEAAQITGLSVSTLWRMEVAGKFPARRQLNANSVGWLESEVLEWVESRAQAETVIA
jgi:prophage regulatory protein